MLRHLFFRLSVLVGHQRRSCFPECFAGSWMEKSELFIVKYRSISWWFIELSPVPNTELWFRNQKRGKICIYRQVSEYSNPWKLHVFCYFSNTDICIYRCMYGDRATRKVYTKSCSFENATGLHWSWITYDHLYNVDLGLPLL